MANHYLDLETGDLIVITDEIRQELEDLYALAYEQDPEADPDLETLIEQAGLHDWQADMVRDADRVEEGYGVRYIQVPQGSSRGGYFDMVAFIRTVDKEDLRNRLEYAIQGRGAFRRFRDVLEDDAAERERRFAFKPVEFLPDLWYH